ncbi:MAG: ABC transporter permease [Armatimonadota bacterium]|nr:ABC transporter permease [Armatimonadota bacterium]MDR7404913.1 ABC transporter permease [Armatimonadota bacterium]
MTARAPSRPGPAALGRPRRTPVADLGSWTVFAAVVLLGWEVGARLYDQPYLLPAPSQILAALRADAPLVLAYARVTAQETVLGFAAGSALALLGAMLFVWLPRPVEEFLYRIVVTLNSTPFVALASLVVVWFGLGITSKVVIAGLYTFFAVLYHTHKEFISVDPMREYLLDVYNATWLQRMLLLKLPSALPIIFTSLKGGVMAAVNGAIVGELFGAFEGLGYMILDSRYVGNTVRVFLAAVFCTLIGWVLLGVVTVAERLLVPWHVSMARERS